MNFLQKIDDMYRIEKEAFAIQKENIRFSLFIPVDIVGYKSTCEFMVKKQEKAKLLLINGKQRVYISDLHIINIILGMSKDEINWFLQRFTELYIGKSYEISFKLGGEPFKGYGIEKYLQKKELHLFSDSIIDINDFIFIINFIFSKDIYWEEMSKKDDFSKRTLCKYISLIDYYANSTSRSKIFLKKIGYPIEESKPIDNRLTKKLFHHTEMFDISLYK